MTQANNRIRVAVSGACGRMGQEVVKAVTNDSELELVSVIDLTNAGMDIGEVIFNKPIGIKIENSLKESLAKNKVDVLVDFTIPDSVYANAKIALESNVRPIIGTTGLSEEQLKELEKISNNKKLAILVAPNFAIGAVLMMMFAASASKYMDHAEIIEIHHNKKKDAPSGTAIKTAQLMSLEQPKFGKDNVQEIETIKGSRGGITDSNIHIHSVRLPGFVAHQEIIFGGQGQALTIRHDSFDRTSFMPGVVLAVKKLMELDKFIYGLENIL